MKHHRISRPQATVPTDVSDLAQALTLLTFIAPQKWRKQSILTHCISIGKETFALEREMQLQCYTPDPARLCLARPRRNNRGGTAVASLPNGSHSPLSAAAQVGPTGAHCDGPQRKPGLSSVCKNDTSIAET